MNKKTTKWVHRRLDIIVMLVNSSPRNLIRGLPFDLELIKNSPRRPKEPWAGEVEKVKRKELTIDRGTVISGQQHSSGHAGEYINANEAWRSEERRIV